MFGSLIKFGFGGVLSLHNPEPDLLVMFKFERV